MIRALVLAAAAQASAAALHNARGDKQGIQWGPCDLDTDLPVQCARLPVPLDYTNHSSNKTLKLDLIKYPAQKKPSKGSILLNFGGPGQDGLHSMLDYAETMAPLTGGHHDLISFDPRGTGRTLQFTCFDKNDTKGPAALREADIILPSSSDTALGRLWADSSIVAESCYSQLKDIGGLVGMAFVSRDMMKIVDALGEDGMLRYWGISGGTILGATVAAMFPDRMDRVLIDGVANSHQYYHSLGESEMFDLSDNTVDGFLAGCLAAPQNCALARDGRTVDDLKDILRGLLHQFKYSPKAYNGTIIDYAHIKGAFLGFLYIPDLYPLLAKAFDSLLSDDLETYLRITALRQVPMQDQAILGIRCGDKIPKASSLKELEPTFDLFRDETEWFPDIPWTYHVMTCAQWKMPARERYEGDFNVKTKNPLLVIGNDFDPVTPWTSAKNMSESFQNAVALRHKGFGHLSFSHPSNCTDKTIRDFFLEGVLPEPGTVCEPNKPIFSAPAPEM
ncbi:hypothetical protein NM208_g11306 [Fusarium decemcellulare]|uniref:Uncharacterized protein n=1 Tax=Fusarium decemcellulare TaxID=57161 RepID=A0ACC1RTC5_9HYPO|nr:hypothetical protein NM208_g11306 [Fusarium decemcellulare]